MKRKNLIPPTGKAPAPKPAAAPDANEIKIQGDPIKFMADLQRGAAAVAGDLYKAQDLVNLLLTSLEKEKGINKALREEIEALKKKGA